MDSQKPADIYDAYYFAHGCGRPYRRDAAWLAYFGALADRIVEEIRPRGVLDAGCALGFLVEKLREHDVEAFGIDISEYAISHVHPDVRPYCWAGSVAEPFPRSYDLIVCIEVLEHMPLEEAERAVANFCRHADDILFSSTPFDYREATHLNVQPPEYWAALFARHGLYRDVDFDGSFLTPWAVRLRRRQEPVHRLVRDYERRFWLLWKENTDLRGLTIEMRDQLSAGEQAIDTLGRHVGQQTAVAQSLSDQLIEKNRALLNAEQRAAELNALIAKKNQHIIYLEQLIRRIEAGRMMQTLRRAGRIRRALAAVERGRAVRLLNWLRRVRGMARSGS